MMDIEKLIEQLRKSADFEDYPIVASFAAIIEKKYLRDAATALSTLRAENEQLREELEQVKHALAMMWFAYVNSDKETPHSYETEAIEEAERLLGPWEECMPKYLRRGKKEE